MSFISAGNFLFHLSIGLLSLPLLTECDKIRLVGPSRCSGRLEVFHRDNWGTVCDDHWSIANAEVVCRELDCGMVYDAKKGGSFPGGRDNIWMDDVQCIGNESSIFDCPQNQLGDNNCDHSEDAGVTCSDHLRVVNGSSRCSGRVEVYHENNWKRVCHSDWTKGNTDVVCREINCGAPATQAEMLYFGEAHNLRGVKANCGGNETSVSQCKFQEFNETCVDATVVCTSGKPLRLMNGTNRCSGRVEIYHNGQWGSICDDGWEMQEADVVCREMNCGTALSVKYKSFFGRGQEDIWLDDLQCTGEEKFLADCPNRGFGSHDCDHNEDAGVICSESIRLPSGTNRCSGRVEVFNNGQWGKICDSNWHKEEAAAVCQELGCGLPRESQETFNFGDSDLKGYTTSCVGNVSTISQCTLQEVTGTCKGVSLACAGISPLRLVNGTDRCSGRVEVLHNDQWGTVCDDQWDIKDAQVVCRAMDCGTAKTAKTHAFFGQGHEHIWLDNVGCVGNESLLLDCPRAVPGPNDCNHGEDAGVVCSADIRLVSGTNQCSGRVEIYHDGRWAPAYKVNWGINEAKVVCREMNCGDPVKFSGSYDEGRYRSGYRFTCNGRESSLTRCVRREYIRAGNVRIEQATVECSGNVRLTGGSSSCSGRVEFFDKNQWGTVCGEAWDENDADVVCRQLDCGRSHKITTTTQYGTGTGHTWTDQIECDGTESTLSQCTQRPFTTRTCNTTSVAGVVCTEAMEVRLANGKDACSGRVEVRHGNTWQTVCDTDWTLNKAMVVCEKMECGHAMNASRGAQFGQGSGLVVEASNSCFESVTSLQQCNINGFRKATCGHEHDAGALCAARVQLVGGSGECSGRVEVLHKGQWGTVCDDSWGMSDAMVVCRQLGCGLAVSAPTGATYGRGTGPIWLDNVACRGNESAITHCTHPGYGKHNCGHGEDAGVICLGAVQKPNITLSPGPEVNFGDTVKITCSVGKEYLVGTFFLKRSQGSFEMTKSSELGAETFTLPTVNFSHNGSYFCEYKKTFSGQVIVFPRGDTAELYVTMKLEKPTISLESSAAMVVYSPVKVSVAQGSSMSVTCSVYSRYPGGYFYLTNSIKSTTQTMPAVAKSVFLVAHFNFSAIDYKSQGEYNCVYGFNVSSKTFGSAPSKSLHVTVDATMVQFINRFGGTMKQDVVERSNGGLYGRDCSNQVIEQAESRRVADARAPENLAGRMTYDFEPLVVLG
ncbi:deleted in malignant brain tumors 1 protein-like [Centropristis striata]|uniref:deleted in malignant brain tumors 1 protein-like n=1 Tax=Centropristis striata TaxID=184440 RepID=UPI0027DFC9EB|nr:deleted in malignant brain tumors 1 protein-like [Centropristis striata]